MRDVKEFQRFWMLYNIVYYVCIRVTATRPQHISHLTPPPPTTDHRPPALIFKPPQYSRVQYTLLFPQVVK